MIDVVIVGSGFGGAVTACRLAAAGRSVCVLERGRRWSAPDFPRSAGQVAEAFWDEGRSHGFLEYLAFRRFDVIQGAGVGGGSLHYFNVNLPAPPTVLAGPAWPAVFGRVSLDPFYDTARAVLGSAPLQPPEGRALPDRTSAFLAAGRRAGYRPELVPIAVHTGSERPCTYCGSCLFGCNDNAKNTLDRNYLALAERDGAEVRPLHVVDGIVPLADGGYEVRYRRLPDDPGAPAERGTIQARQVIVAAGALGSTELLLRSRQQLGAHGGLGSPLGTRFSLNGEFLFAYARDVPGPVSPGLGPPITARITATSGELMVTVEDLGVPDSLLWYLEGAMPQPFARLRRLAAVARDYVLRTTGRSGVPAGVGLSSLVSSSRTARAMPYLGMGTDSSDGAITLRNGALDVRWRPRSNRDLYRLMDRTMRDVSEGAGGRYSTSVLARWPLRKILTAHPLGGCPMGDNPRTSVVDDRGQVHGHAGLFVIDGSIVPTALAVNPSLTIAALAERAAAAMVHPAVATDDLVPLAG